MMQKLTKVFGTLCIALGLLFTALAAQAFEPTGESFPASFKMTSWTSSAAGSSLTAEGLLVKAMARST